MVSEGAPGVYKDKLYFNSTRNYTLALLNAFNNINTFVDSGPSEKAFTVPITFGNYEKALVLDDYNENEITSLNFNFLPRLVLSFEGIEKAAERQTQKYQKFSKLISTKSEGNQIEDKLEYSYNSVAYDFNFRLLLQTRGLTSASQLTEIILVKFNPTLNLMIQEFPLLDPTETQIIISDPEFEIIDDFETTDVNIINVSFAISIRGNIYSPIGLSGAVRSIGMYLNVWDAKMIKDSNLASYYKFDLADDSNNVNKIHERHFDGTGPGTYPGISTKELGLPEDELIKVRPDFDPKTIITDVPDVPDIKK